MVKNLEVKPGKVRKSQRLKLQEIPVNVFDKSFKDAAAQFPLEDVLRMHRDMCFLREFETMLDRIKKEGAYEGVKYSHKGPAHLSIGQESLAVGLPLSE